MGKIAAFLNSFKKAIKRKTKISKWPSKKQWALLFKVLNKKEKIVFSVFLGLFLFSAVFLIVNLYLTNTEAVPAVGGRHVEGVVGSPRFINPIYAQSSDVDRDLVEIIFSSLADIAQEIKVKDEGEVYEIYLKENVLWHDGESLTADDVIFTIETIQDPDYKSPLRANYIGLQIEKVNEYAVRFKLPNAYSAFTERLDVKILPQHIWQSISPQNFLLTNYNLKPIGSGPYQFKELKQDGSNAIVSLTLVRFKNYFESDLKKPYLTEISFRFFESTEELVKAARSGELDGFSVAEPEYFEYFQKSKKEYSLDLPRYFAVFFNADKARFLADENIRLALNYATDKAEIIDQVLLGRGEVVNSPILPELYNYESPSEIYELNPEKVEELLVEAGMEKIEGKWVKAISETITEFKSELKVGSRGTEVTNLQTCLARDSEVYPEGQVSGYFGSKTKEAVIRFQEKYYEDILEPWGFDSGTGIVSKTTRAKLNEICLEPPKATPLKFTLATVEDPLLEATAQQLKKQWGDLGIEIEIETYPLSQLTQDIIKPRNYEMLLFGEVLGEIPDPYPFWHSDQVKDPGLNLAKYDNSKADKLLEAARISLDEETRAEKYQQFQDILIEDAPCLFLYRPDYVYFANKNIKGIDETMIVDPSKRFSRIEDWYIKTKRSW